MSLYDEIKSPLDDNQMIIQLLKAFDKAGMVVSQTEDEWGNKLRGELISGVSVDSEEYKNKMVKYVEKDALETLFNNIKTILENNPKYFENYDRQVESILEEQKKRIQEKYKGDDEFEIRIRIDDSNKTIKDRNFMYQISKFKNVILSSDFNELYKDGNFKDEVCKDLFGQLRKSFLGEKKVMGFHVSPEKMLQLVEKKKDDIKFYINAGADTYKFASFFRKECEENNMYYYFKVVGKADEEFNRDDKMCIYSIYEDAEKYVEIIKKIAKENPDIKFENPPVLNGRIDDFIGVGTDHVGNKGGSYNQKMCNICSAAIRSVYSEWTGEKVEPDGRKFYNSSSTPFIEYAKQHPEKIEILKEEIKKRAKEIGLDEEKICIVPELRPGYKPKNNNPKTMQANNRTPDLQKNEVIYNQPNNELKNQEENIKDFVLNFVKSYKQLETNPQYDKRLDREENDIEYVADYVNKSRKGEIDEEYFLGLQPEELDKYGRVEFSQDNIDRMFRMLNAANNLTIGNHKYLEDFCMSPGIKGLLEQMQQSSKIQEMIKVAEREKALGQQGRAKSRGLTPAEKDCIDAKVALKEWQKSGYSDNKIFDNIIDNQHMNWGYESNEDLALARICCRQRGIKVEYRALQGRYKLDIVDQTKSQDFIDPQKIKQDTIIAGVNISDITRRTKLFIDKFSRRKNEKSEEKSL